MSDEYQQMLQQLETIKTELTKYQKMYQADGEIDTKERQELDARIVKLLKVETALNGLLGTPNSDPIRWGDIEHEYAQELNSRIQEAISASDRAKNYITDANESKDGSMVVSAMLSIISSFGPQYAISVEIFKGAMAAMQSSPPNNLTTFHSTWVDNLEKQDNKTGYKAFRSYFTNQYLQGCTEDQVSHSTVLTIMKSYINSHFFTRVQMEQFYVRSWIDSAQDERNWFGFNDNDEEAGYIKINLRYQYPVISLLNGGSVDIFKDGFWYDDKIFIDDMPRPEGTNNALTGVYGSGTKISDLPLKIKVSMQVTTAPNMRAPGWTGPCLFERSKSGNWSIKLGPQKFFDLFINDHLPKLTVNHIGVE